MKKKFSFFSLAFLIFIGTCQAQLPTPTSYQVDLSWTIPATCTTALPCTFAVYRTIAGASAYTLVITSASQASTAIDMTVVAGQSYDYEVQTNQGGAVAAPSLPVLVTIPGIPSTVTGLAAVVKP